MESIDELKDWYGQSIEVKSDPLIDSGSGGAVILRAFKYQINPEIKHIPTKQELFNSNAREIRVKLFSDGLEPMDIEPRIAIGKESYTIFVTCKPKIGVALMETPQTLQDLIKPNDTKSADTGQNPV